MNKVMKVTGWIVTAFLLLLYGGSIVFSSTIACQFRVTDQYTTAVLLMAGTIVVGCLLAAYGVSRMKGVGRICFLIVVILLAIFGVWSSGIVLGVKKPESGRWFGVFFPFFTLIAISLVTSVHAALRKYDTRGFARGAIMAILVILFVPFLHDAPPVPRDEIPADFIPSWPGAKESQDVMLTFYRGGPKILNVNARNTGGQDVSNITVYASEVEKAWEDVAEGRKVIEKLDTFDRIADLTDPAFLDVRNGITNQAFMNYLSYRNIAHTTWSYAQLLTERGKSEEAAKELVRLYSVSSKAMPNMLILIDKMVWVAICGGTVQRAYRIASHPSCSREALKILKDGFVPMSNEAVSLRNTILGEFLGISHYFYDAIRKGKMDSLMTMAGGTPARRSNLRNVVNRSLIFLTCRPNQTIRDYKKFADLAVAGVEKMPPEQTAANQYLGSYLRTPGFKNTAGRLLLAIAIPDYTKAMNTALGNKIRSELLAMYLSQKLGENLVLNDPYTGKPYRVDANGMSWSVGPDRKAGTADDVLLPPKDVR
ncbi:MAG: hypothetical protein PHR77_05800 [Kiritimatiellae bacterium]|nr:hypothetical protein [Kiritimatiellia bacterium]MDD5523138.1 hypothetical protein [Kiritimatiellia bacterium]